MQPDRWFGVGFAAGREPDAGARAAHEALRGADAKLLVVFCSPSCDLPAVLKGILAEAGGVRLIGCTTAGEALAAVERLAPDVVLVDVSLGGESGFDLVARMHGQHPATAIILISTYSEADFVELVEASPAVGFVPKAELSAAAVHRLISERRGR